jgi:hypothetical protein
MQSKDNKHKLNNTKYDPLQKTYKSETNYNENLSKTQQAFLIVSETSETHTDDSFQELYHETLNEEEMEWALMSAIEPMSPCADEYIPEPRDEWALIKMNEGKIKHEWIQKSILEVKGLIKENTFSLDYMPEENEKVTPTKFVFKAKIKSDGNLDKCKARLVVRGDLQSQIPGDQWSPTASFRLLRRFIAESARTGKSIKQLDFIAAFVQAVVKERLFVKLPGCLKKYFPHELEKYFDRPLKLVKGLYEQHIQPNGGGKNFTSGSLTKVLNVLNQKNAFM